MKNFFIKKWSDLFIYLSKTVRKWFENGSRKVRQMCAAWAMLLGKLVYCAKSLMQIFATYATYASAIFVGEESNESTVRYALWSRISLIKPLQNPYKTLTRFRLLRYAVVSRSRSVCSPRTPSLFKDKSQLSFPSLASLICLCMLTAGVGNAWGATQNFVPADFSGGTSGTGSTVNKTLNGIQVSTDKGYATTQFRVYKGGKLTISSDYTIKAINFTTTSSYGGGLSNQTNLTTTSWSFTTTGQARITQIVVTYLAKVTFNANEGSCATSNLTQATANSSITLPTPNRSGFTCTGWYTASSGGTKRGNAGDTYTPTTSETLYAQWESAATVNVTGVSVSPTSKAILVGETFTVTPTIAPADATDKTVAWTTSASGKASVNSSGLVTGVAAGSATITCTTNDGSYTANTAVTVYSASVSIVDEDGTDISGSGVTATISGRTLTASEGSTKYKFKGWKYGTASGTSIASSSSLSTTLTGTPTGNVEVIAEFYKPVTVTWLVGSSSASGSPTTSVKRGSKITALPSTPADNAIGACANKFKGWSATSELIGTGNSAPADLFTSASDAGVVALTSPTTYRAVFATSYTTKVPTPNTYTHTIESKTWDGTGSQTLTSKSWSLSNNGDYYGYDATKGQQVGSGNNPASSMTLSSSAFSGTITSVKISTSGGSSISATVGVSVGSTDFTKNGDGLTKTVSLTSTNTEYTFSGSATGTITISWAQTSSKAIYFKKIVVGYTTMEDGTDYKDYVTECCTQLGSINGSVSWSNPTEAVVSWDNLANVSSWTVKYKEHGAGAWTTAFTNKTGSDSEITLYSDGGTDNKMKSIIATTCNTAYDFLIIANPASGYCDKEEELNNSGSGYNSGKWSVAYSLTGVTKSSGPATGANVCGDYTAVFAPSSVAYALPSNVTVQIGGVTKAKDTDYTWDSSTGTLSIASTKITGDLSITVTGIEVGCSADPTIGAASLSGAFGLSSVGVTVATSSTGNQYCAWTDYGFVWGTSANPTVSDNKVQIGNSDAATTWSGNLTGSFSTGTTYYFRAYGTNSKTGAVPVYGTGNSFTPRSVTFDSNGGSAVAIAYVNSGSAVSEPSAPTRTGYDFVKWQLNGADYSFSSAVNANITLDAVWSAKSYTVTLDKQSGSGGSGSVLATYDAAMPSATMPTRSGYTFGGYYGSEGGAGTQYYAADGSSAHTWDVADAKTLYAKWTAKNYTITLNNEGADSGKEGTTSISVTFDANTNLTSAITKPVKDGYKFGGYYTEEDGSGTQIIDENGNVNASVTSYTSATKQWIYADNIELHAYWKPSYTVTWSVNGETTTEQVVSGEQVAALPTAPTSSDCDDAKVFVGWRSTAIDGVSAANPGSIFTTQAASPAITGNVTFYAVFADESGGDFTRVTSTSQLAAGKQIVMGYEETANSGIIIPVQSNTYNSDKNILYTGTTNGAAGTGTITISSNPDVTNYLFTLRAGYNSGYWAFEMSGTLAGEYIGYSGKNTIQHYEGIQTDGKTDFSITFGTNDTASIVNKYGTANYITESGKNKYYKYVSYNYNNGNPRVSIYQTRQTSALVLYICNPLVYSNYVTSCSSCDADATFTNTTPVVSAIDCDAATLTATGGLATLGADGCNVSDYGFVIGTSDNPVIGGSGVTKLQVGTTNPTTGADFSYDVDDLTKGTHYYIRAYATNRHGTAYSGSQNFWTKGVSSIAITTAPTKTTYIAGESFDASGMVVKATLVDGTTPNVTGDVTYSTTGLSAGTNQDFAINYSLCGDNVSTNQKINVYAMTVTEGTADDKGVVTYTSGATFSISSLATHWTANIVVTNGTANDNGDGTYTVTPSGAGAVSVTVNYVEAAQVKVYYKVDGVTVTGLTRDVYQSETTTLPTASELATAMTAQGMDIPDDSYPNFVGWSETEFGAQTSEPTLVTGTPTINAEKTYYAVYTNLGKKTILPTDFPTSYGDGDRSIDGVTYYRSGVAKPSSSIQFRSSKNGLGYIYSKTSLSYILKIEVSGDNLVVNACSDASGTLDGDAITPVGTAPRVYTFPANKQYFKIKGNGETNTASHIDIYYSPATVEYMTQFCTRYDITGVTKSGTAVTGGTLTSNYNSACEGKSVELEAVVSTGYQFNGWTIKKTADLTQDVTSTLLGANASSLTPPAFSMPAYAITVSASITEKELTGWTWKQALPDESIAIPSKVVLYVGQQARFELISYDPSDVLTEKKGYNADYTNADLAQVAQAEAHYVTRAKAAVESTTLTLTSTSNGSVQEVINIQIKALPSVTFEDHVHSVVFSAVAATINETDKRVVYLTKTTPTTSDYSGTTYNTCEEQHEHLVGWIESSWADEHPNATHSEIAGAGAGVFYTAGASIDVEAQNGKTFYAVWSKIE